MRGEEGISGIGWGITQMPEYHCTTGQMGEEGTSIEGEDGRRENGDKFVDPNIPRRNADFVGLIRSRGVWRLLWIRP